jgi:anti-anti-sigma factor
MAMDTHRPARDRGDDLRSAVKARDAGRLVLSVTGALSGGPATERMAGTIRRLLPDPGIDTLVLDLEDVDYLSSVGLARLLLIRPELAGAGTSLRVVNPRGQVLEKLRLTGLAPALLG